MKNDQQNIVLVSGLSHFFVIFLVLTNLINSGGFVHFVLLDKVGHVGAGLIEFDGFETFVDVPVNEGAAGVHLLELGVNAGEELTESGGVTDEGAGHLETTWWDISDGRFDVGWDPFDEVGSVTSLDVQHLFIDFFRGHTATEVSGNGEVNATAWVAGSHHVLVVEELGGKFWDGKSAVLLGTTGGKWSEANDEEVKTWEWNKVDSELTKISVKLTWETK